MKLLIYTHAFAPKIGGVESTVMSLARGLATFPSEAVSGKLSVTLVTATPRGDFDDASLPFKVLRQPGWSGLLRLILSSDIIHLAGPCFFPLLAALLLRKPVVVEHHGFQTICPNGQLLHEPTRLPCAGQFMAGRHMDCIRCNAKNGLARSLALWFFTFPRRWLSAHASANIMPTNWLSGLLRLPKSTTVYHGVHIGHQAPVSASACSTFAFVGRLVSTKGVRTLLQAAERIRSEGFRFRLKVIGDGPDKDSLESEVKALGLDETVTFYGYIPEDDLEKHLADVSGIVMPSLAGEVFGLVAAENMARGKLLIASDTGALSEVVAETGLTFSPGNVAELALCMKRVLQDGSLASQLGHSARQRAIREFGKEQMLGRHLDVYSKVVACAN